MMGKIILLIPFLAFLVISLAEAGQRDLNLSWQPPTERVDGTPMNPASELREYRLTCGDRVTVIPPLMPSEQPYQFLYHEVLPGYGAFQCFMTSVDIDGLESPGSEPIELAWRPSPPMAPTNLIVIKGADNE